MPAGSLRSAAGESIMFCGGRFLGEVVGNALGLGILPRVERYVTFVDGASALAAQATHPAVVALICQNLPDSDGLDLVESMAALGCLHRVMLIADPLSEWSCLRLMSGVLDSFFDLSIDSLSGLTNAIGQLRSGGCYRSSSLREARRRATAGKTLLDLVLSPTEMVVFSVLADGCDDVLAGERLGLARLTIQSHRQRIMKKLELRSRVELVQEAERRGVARSGATALIRPACPSVYRERARSGTRLSA